MHPEAVAGTWDMGAKKDKNLCPVEGYLSHHKGNLMLFLFERVWNNDTKSPKWVPGYRGSLQVREAMTVCFLLQ